MFFPALPMMRAIAEAGTVSSSEILFTFFLSSPLLLPREPPPLPLRVCVCQCLCACVCV
jgi:hypothetical protein